MSKTIFDRNCDKTNCSSYCDEHLNIKVSYDTIFEPEKITPFEVWDKLDGNKATGMNGFSPTLLKMCSEKIAQVISHISNISISNCLFLSKLKEERVISMHKGCKKKISIITYCFTNLELFEIIQFAS